jgi:hypothetical protein
MLIPVSSLSATYDVVGWSMTVHNTYFTVVATQDNTTVDIDPTTVPLAGGPVPGTGAPFSVLMDEGDVLEVSTQIDYESFTGTRVRANGGEKLVLFTGNECTNVPLGRYSCDHLEEQLPGLRFWGTEFVGGRMPIRFLNDADPDKTLWQIYASEDNTQITFTAHADVLGVPVSPVTLNQGETLEFQTWGTPEENPGDVYIKANRPISVMEYMTGGGSNEVKRSGDPAMAYVSPVEQFLPRYVVLVPDTWTNDALIITRQVGSGVLVNGSPVPDSEFTQVPGTFYEVARYLVPDGVYSLESANGEDGLGVIVAGWALADSYAYTGGMGLSAINPIID